MKLKLFFFSLCSIFLMVVINFGQSFSSAVEIVTVYSQNEKYYLKSIPYDNEEPSLRGKTYVYQTGNQKPLYEFERGFDSINKNSNNLILSNNGEIIFFVISWGADEDKEGLKSITIYKNGKIIKSFTETEITGCDYKKERCDLLYYNENAVDRDKSRWTNGTVLKVFNDGIDEKEKFLSDFRLFHFEDSVYLVDSKKKVHIFDLKDVNSIKTDVFDNIFEQLKKIARFNKVELQRFEAPTFLDYPNLKNGKNTHQILAQFIGMKPVDDANEKDEKFKWYRFKIDTNIYQDGTVEIENLELFDELPKEKITEFFKINKFDSHTIPKEVEKWNIKDEYFYFRKADENLARKEKQQEIIKEREALKKRLVAEKLNDIYIPKDLGDCFAELDRMLSEIDKKEFKSAKTKNDLLGNYHMGLGMWMRNNWGLWGGSRLQKYFTDKKIGHPDDMSSVVLFFYHDWLNGKKETWKEWEKNPMSVEILYKI